MADNDDIKNKPVNSLVDEGFNAIERIGRRSSQRSAEDRNERVRIKTAHETKQGLQELINEMPIAAESPSIRNGLKANSEIVNRLGGRIRLRRDARVDRAQQETYNAVEREFSDRNVNSQVNGMIVNDDTQLQAAGMMGMPYKEIEGQRSGIMSKIGGLEKKALTATNGLYDKEGRPNEKVQAELKGYYQQKAEQVQQLSVVAAAEKKKRALGQDPESQLNTLYKTGQKAESILSQESALADRKEGKGLGAFSPDELKKQEVQHANELVNALKKLSDGTVKTKEAMEALQTEAGAAAENLKKTQEASAVAGGSKASNVAGFMNNLGGILAPIGQGYQQIAINNTMQVKQNQMGYANAANQMFDQRKSAISGNMTDLTLLGSDSFDRASKEDAWFKTQSRVVGGINVATGATQAVAGTAMAINGAKNAGATLGFAGQNDLTQGIQQGVSGVVQTAVAGDDLYRSISAGSTGLQGSNMNLAQDRENVKVTGAMRQQFYDYSSSMREATVNVGGSAGKKIEDAFANEGTLNRLEKASIGTSQFAELSAMGGQAQGSVFNTNQVFAARNLERSGNGSMAQNIGRMSTLAAAGANNPEQSLAAVLEASFSKSLSSSAALNKMVENTGAMAANSMGSQMGFLDTTKSSSSILANLIDPNTKNQEMAAGRANTAAGILNDINSGTGSNYADMSGVASIMTNSGVSRQQATILKKTDDTTAASMQAEIQRIKGLSGKDRTTAESKFSEDLINQGYGEFTGRDTNGKRNVKLDDLDKGFKERSKSVYRSGVFQATVNQGAEGYKDLVDGKMSTEQLLGDSKYDALAVQAGQAASLSGLSLKEQSAGGKPTDTSAGAGAVKSAMSGETSKVGAMQDDLSTAKYQEMSKEARLAAKELGGVTEALKAIREATKGISGKLNDDTAGDFRTAAAQAAIDMKSAAGTFLAGANKFGQIVGAMKVESGDRLSIRPGVITDKTDAMTGKK